MNENVTQEEESMEDILSSIRETVEEEVAKEQVESTPDQEAAPAEEQPQVETASADTADDILDLTEVVEETGEAEAASTAPVAEHELETDLVDVNAFEESGEVKAADGSAVDEARKAYSEEGDEPTPEESTQEAAPAEMSVAKEENEVEAVAQEDQPEETSDEEVTEEVAPAEEAASDDDMDFDVDSLMSEMAAEGTLPEEDVAPAKSEEDLNEDLVAEANENTDPDKAIEESLEDLTGGAGNLEEVDSNEAIAEMESAEETSVSAEKTPAVDEGIVATATAAVTQKMANESIHLNTIPSPKGLQVGFPMEVLAEALRPLVTDWVEANLADVVERLVREELSRLVEK